MRGLGPYGQGGLLMLHDWTCSRAMGVGHSGTHLECQVVED